MLLLGQFFVDPPLITSPPAGALDPGEEDVPYSVTITTTGSGILTFSLISGAFPVGITLDPSTGIISGTTSDPNTYNFTIRVRDTFNQYYDRIYSLVIASGLTDYVTNMTAEWISGDDADFNLTGANIDSWKENSSNADFLLTKVLDGGYTTLATHDTTLDLDGDKTVNTAAASPTRYRSEATGTVADIIPGNTFTIFGIISISSFVNAFGSNDPIIYAENGNAPFFIDHITGKKLRFGVYNGSSNLAIDSAAFTNFGDWIMFFATYDNDKLRLQVSDTAVTTSIAHVGGPSGDTRVSILSNIGSGGYLDGYIKLLRVYSEKVSDTNIQNLKDWWRSVYASIV